MFLGSPPAPCADPGPHGLQSVCSGLQSAAQRVFNVLELVESIVNSACYDPTDVHITDLRHCRRCWGKLRRVNTTFRDVVTPLLFRFVRASHHTATTRHAHFLPLLLLPEHAPVMAAIRCATVGFDETRYPIWSNLLRAMPNLATLELTMQCSTADLPISGDPLLPLLAHLDHLTIVDPSPRTGPCEPGWLEAYLGRPEGSRQLTYVGAWFLGSAGQHYIAYLGSAIHALCIALHDPRGGTSWLAALTPLTSLHLLNIHSIDDHTLERLPPSICHLRVRTSTNRLVELLHDPTWLPDLKTVSYWGAGTSAHQEWPGRDGCQGIYMGASGKNEQKERASACWTSPLCHFYCV